MPLPMKDSPEPKMKKAQVLDKDDIDSMIDMPKEAPSSDLATSQRTKRGLPSSKVTSGPVTMRNPNIDLSRAPDPTNFIMGYEGEDVDEEEGFDDPVPEPTDLPTIIHNELSTQPGEIKSYQMSNIIRQAPGPMQQQLQKIGRDIFSQHSETPKTLKDIYAITSLTNSETEVKIMVAWILMHGRKLNDAQYNFPSMPGYKPKAELWESEGARFLIVRETPKDFAGQEIEETFDDPDFEEKVDNKECIFYIYGWDEPKEAIGSNNLKADLLEAAKTLAKRHRMTIQEAYDELIDDFIFDDDEDLPPEALTASDFDDIPETGFRTVPFIK